ncbi:MAG: type II toxin-antitoxin system HicA family toxin [Desulfotomaculales bacterium]
MARIPRDVTGEEAIRALLRAGGVRRGGKGSHVNIKMPNGRIVTIPQKGRLKVGLLRDAIGKAGLSVEEFVRLLGKGR